MSFLPPKLCGSSPRSRPESDVLSAALNAEVARVTCSTINNENAIHVIVGLSADFECAFAEEVGIEGRRPIEWLSV
jgi:hypothetical protein